MSDSPSDHLALTVTVHLLGIGLPIVLGVIRLSHRSNDRFAWLLVGTGFLWFLVSLCEAGDATLYSVGRVAVWVFEAALVYLVLAFPLGRLTSDTERRLFRVVVTLVAVLYLPTALVAPFPEPSPWAACGTDCPDNAFMLTDSAPGVVDTVIRPLREVLTVALYGLVAAVLVGRARRSGALMRRVIVPVAVVAAYRTAGLGSYQVLRAGGNEGLATEIVGTLYMLTLPLVTLSFAAGLLRQRLFVAKALERLTAGLKRHTSPEALRVTLSQALEDPHLRIAYWLNGREGRWVDESGLTAKEPRESNGRAVTEVMAAGRLLAAITHDSGLDPVLVNASSSYALTALENERLIEELSSSLDELASSRARIVAVADDERRRIERDLHDGAQQRLVALRIKLELLAEGLDANSPARARAVRALEHDVDDTIDEVRSFARGIYPPLLAERGLSEALGAVGRGAHIPTVVKGPDLPRFRPEVEATVYFACTEALQNVAKHASNARGVTISLSQNPHLRFSVKDDGDGFDASEVNYGSGLINMRDRLGAVGGELVVESRPGDGTTVTGIIPAG